MFSSDRPQKVRHVADQHRKRDQFSGNEVAIRNHAGINPRTVPKGLPGSCTQRFLKSKSQTETVHKRITDQKL